MYTTNKSLYDRSLEKTPEQLFINSLRKEYELSPAESAGILELAKGCLFGEVPKQIGKQKFLCASRNAKHGRALKEQEMVEVELTLDGGIEDLDVLRKQGSQALRQLKVLRLTEEAYQQGGLLTQEDIGRLLQVSSRTIRDDIRELQKDGNTVHTRGNDQDIGRGLSHKSRIVELYVKGYTYDEIMRRTRHSAHAIKRYVSNFGRLLLIKNHDRPGLIGHLGTVLGEAKINIAGMTNGRDKPGGLAITVVNVDEDVPPKVMEQIKKFKHVIDAKLIKL